VEKIVVAAGQRKTYPVDGSSEEQCVRVCHKFDM
jgi:hypothetical protein